MQDLLWKSLLGLQVFQVAFLLLHDWLPMPPLNNIAAQRATDPFRKRIVVLALNALPFVALLWGTINALQHHATSGALLVWLWVGYGLLFVGELNAWWIPYLLRPDPERAARYAQLFEGTHAFLRKRNGIRPNTLHVVLHMSTLLTLIVLGTLTTGYVLR